MLRDFNSWLAEVPCQEKVIIGGNHDTALQELGQSAHTLLSSAVWLQDSCVTLPRAGIKIYGHAHSIGDSHNNAWSWKGSQGEAPSICRESCDGADVVMTHACSDAIQTEVLGLVRPRLWASGHWHGSHGVTESGGTVFVNAAIQDGKYNPTQLPVVVDLPRLQSDSVMCSI